MFFHGRLVFYELVDFFDNATLGTDMTYIAVEILSVVPI